MVEKIEEGRERFNGDSMKVAEMKVIYNIVIKRMASHERKQQNVYTVF